MASILDVLKTQAILEKTLNDRLNTFEAQLKAPAGEVSLKHLNEEFRCFRDQINTSVSLLRQQISHLIAGMDAIENRHRKKFLLLGGIDERTNESVREATVTVITKHLGIQELTPDKLVVCHRLGAPSVGRCRPILIKFNDPSLRQTIWAKKSLFKGSSYLLSEYLTRMRQSLFIEARKHFGINKVWTLDGVISVKLPDNSRVKIFMLEDLEKLIAMQKPMESSVAPVVDSAASSSRSTSAAPKYHRSTRATKK